ncbi:MAG: type II secretion system GspH family protein [Gammaproteobacteria bacterium]|nr:type II secretion system GspH family protein [Gammaproteobacteria bacterium]MBU2056837.1 type II secretion system GspH family protein [Gammaproteobacteria bacterium]MBU2174631.1 type II secretion system GspH family protein [Gammaproteobacteria bacterium]MBU2248324.1 type II secretion system GspH family protein [Gammaproteobacteria bacterium]MBU2346193.1 type II secretion system GspH family protein [Gammaproteobacteria bacterium]
MRKTSTGFTLVELIIVIVLLGIVSATALPKLFGNAGTDEITAQDQMISVLRRMQIQAMQQTNTATFCHQLILTQTQLGFPNVLPCDPTETNTQLTAAANQNSGLQFMRPANSSLGLSLFNTALPAGGTSQTLPFLFRFNSLGQPVTNAGAVISSGLRIEITDVVTYRICIEREGYIHPC